MSQANSDQIKPKVHFIDRLQFLGVIGPFIVLLTLFSVFLRGSYWGWYLFVSTLVGLPLCWQWATKGLVSTVGAQLLLLLCLYSFMPEGEKLWQIGASMSLILGLFVTYLGFEEIKEMMDNLHLESQSRLDNLIELDEQLKAAQKDWDLSQEDYLSQIVGKDQMISKLSEQAQTLEQSTDVILAELKELQETKQKYIEQLEAVSMQSSKLDIELKELQGESQDLQKQLSMSQSDREREYLDQNAMLQAQIENYQSQFYELEEKLQVQTDHENNLNQSALKSQEDLEKMQETLRGKVGQIYDLESRLEAQKEDIKSAQIQTEDAFKKVQAKEHELVDMRAQIQSRDQKIHEMSQKIRDHEQDIEIARHDLDRKIKQLKALEGSQEETSNEHELRIKSKNIEIDAMHKELEEKGSQLNKLLLRNQQADETLRQYEEEIVEMREEMDQKMAQKHKELTTLNEARFALYQANLDKERLRKELAEASKEGASNTPPLKGQKHWLVQLQSILSQTKYRKVDLENMPKDLRAEIVTLNQSKALYTQLREQFDDKNKVLEEVREKLFKTESQLEKLKKQREADLIEDSKIETELEKNIFVKEEEIKTIEEEVSTLNGFIEELLSEIHQLQSS